MPTSLKHCFLLLFLLPLMAFSQSQRVDSLRQVFASQSLSASEQGLLAFKIAEQFRNSRFLDSALYYADIGLEISENAGEGRRMMYYYLAGHVHSLSGSHLLANKFFNVGMDIALEKEDSKYQAFFSNSAGISAATSGNYQQALESFYTAYKLFEEFGQVKQALSAKKNIANLHGKIFEEKKAISLLQEVYNESIDIGYHRMGCRVLIIQAELYESLGSYAQALVSLEKALIHKLGPAPSNCTPSKIPRALGFLCATIICNVCNYY